MITNYIIYDPIARMFVREGKELRLTYNINHAKHLTSEWSAQQVINRWKGDLEGYIIIKQTRY